MLSKKRVIKFVGANLVENLGHLFQLEAVYNDIIKTGMFKQDSIPGLWSTI